MSWKLRRLAAGAAENAARPFLVRSRPSPAEGFVLAYHRIGVPGDSLLDHALWNASARQFEQQLRWIMARAEIIPLLELPAALAKGRGRYVAVTFDDGYHDNHAVAFPILRSVGATATFFVSTGFVDQPATPWWDEIAWIVRSAKARALCIPGSTAQLTLDGPRDAHIQRILREAKKVENDGMEAFVMELASSAGTGRIPDTLAPRWMNWDELREMETAGMDIGGHTVSHPVLSRLTPEAQYRELRTSYERIRQECGHRQRAMSYPVGGASAFGRPTQEAARRAEWIMACNYRGGHLRGGIPDLFSVPRLQMQPYTRVADLAAIFAWPDRFA